ncbi:hypothetical protein [Pseudomonas taiwanensis]|uniref:hypothetical protein n=1 Tax=Pseudomonas taiwanensis TaxID=470150 RepID=UPI000675F016|nr:hypothetical protein [Pseudomonas taiwanensis]
MKKSDFEYNADLFRGELASADFATKWAKDKLLDMFRHWRELGSVYLDGAVLTSPDSGEGRLDGEVMGKKFSVQCQGDWRTGFGMVEAVVCTKSLVTAEPIEVARFLVSQNGAILSTAGEQLVSQDHPQASYQTFVAVIRRVLNASS